jgi:DNA-binding transcriptional LysR family regulator
MIANSQLPTFVVVAELQNISAAAKRLGVTQTGVTQRIKSLEQSLGSTLFMRSRSGVRLTEEGRLLQRYCLEVSNLEGQIFSGLKGTGKSREVELCIVGPMSLLAGRVAPRYSEVAPKWPHLNLRFIIDSHANRLNQLKRGSLRPGVRLASRSGIGTRQQTDQASGVPARRNSEMEKPATE